MHKVKSIYIILVEFILVKNIQNCKNKQWKEKKKD